MTNDEFRAWRKRVGLTQAECGKVLGYSQQHICLLESGKFPIPPAVGLATIGYEFQEKANDFRELLDHIKAHPGYSEHGTTDYLGIFSEHPMPTIGDVASMSEVEKQTERLINHFGGPEKWAVTARQIDSWARSSLPSYVMEALSTTYEGVLAMHKMMTNADSLSETHSGLVEDPQEPIKGGFWS